MSNSPALRAFIKKSNDWYFYGPDREGFCTINILKPKQSVKFNYILPNNERPVLLKFHYDVTNAKSDDGKVRSVLRYLGLEKYFYDGTSASIILY
jgi:hypothetical protein